MPFFAASAAAARMAGISIDQFLPIFTLTTGMPFLFAAISPSL